MVTAELQREHYLDRRGEWLSKRHVFCPIPTCSAFVPTWVYVILPSHPQPGSEVETFQLVGGEEVPVRDSLELPGIRIKPEAMCRNCEHEFCTYCRREPHVGKGEPMCTLPDIDADEVLEKKLDKWGLRRW